MVENPYLPVEATVEKIIDETPNIKTCVLKPSREIKFRTGQFVQLTIPGIGEAPFTPSSSPHQTEKIELTVMEAGLLTDKLHEMGEGEIVGIRGPYGRGYPIDDFYDKEVLILGGGVGMAPLRSLLLTLLEDVDKFRRIVLCYGARTPEDIVYKYIFPEWKKKEKLEILRSVDKAAPGWQETEGLVTVLLDKVKMNLRNSVAVVCGPPIMMKFGTLKLMDLGYKPENIYLSMEKNMSCGLGKCGHCALGKYYVCKDGPVFRYDLIKDVPDIWL
ncbi:FAD/NAD(P)-binding protein [bacterium]|nr:FAD/NAD(P)-binding protein [bacterium]